jgi:hypothetical protein
VLHAWQCVSHSHAPDARFALERRNEFALGRRELQAKAIRRAIIRGRPGAFRQAELYS